MTRLVVAGHTGVGWSARILILILETDFDIGNGLLDPMYLYCDIVHDQFVKKSIIRAIFIKYVKLFGKRKRAYIDL